MRSTQAESFWARHVEGWRSSGLTQKQYGARHGINAQSLAQWSSALKRKSPSGSSPALVPIRIVDDALPRVMELHCGPWHLAVPVGTDPRWLAALMRETLGC